MPAVQVLEYLDEQGHSPYAAWFESLSAEAAAKVATALYRIAEGNFSNVKSVGSGVLETSKAGDRDGQGQVVQLQASKGRELTKEETWQ